MMQKLKWAIVLHVVQDRIFRVFLAPAVAA
jgi:hypothetical protein